MRTPPLSARTTYANADGTDVYVHVLVAATTSITTGPGVVDVYDVATDCRQPQPLSSTGSKLAA